MEFGIFQGGTVGPRPWDQAEPDRLRQDVEMGIAADAAGFDTFWAPEHHCLEEYSHASSSHLACLAVGVQTKNIRVVTGIFNICPDINHPVRVAEQIAYIDILTHGRVELGTGRGSGNTEVNTFGIDSDDTREMWEEAIRAIPKMWTQELFSHQGKYFNVPERAILPKPVQRPHPPLWVTASNPSTLEVAGRLGLGAAIFNFADPIKMMPLVESYKNAIAHAEPVGEFVNDKIMTVAPCLCLEDGDEAREIFSRGASDVGAHFSVYFDTIPAFAEKLKDFERPLPQSKLRELIQAAQNEADLDSPFKFRSADPEFLHKAGILVGTPEEVIETIRRFRKAGFDQLVTIPGIGWSTPHEKCLESIALMGEKVLPVLRAEEAGN